MKLCVKERQNMKSEEERQSKRVQSRIRLTASSSLDPGAQKFDT